MDFILKSGSKGFGLRRLKYGGTQKLVRRFSRWLVWLSEETVGWREEVDTLIPVP
jgi:hypothetical protein